MHGLTAAAFETNVAGDTTSRFGAATTSGAGGGSVGVAGSVSINLVTINTTGAIRSGASVDAGLGDVSLSAASNSVSTVSALPGVATGGSSFGLGISFALSIVNDTTSAGIEDTGVLTNAHDLTLAANGQHAMTTDAKTGAAGGGVTIVPSISIAISNITSTANIGTGALLTADRQGRRNGADDGVGARDRAGRCAGQLGRDRRRARADARDAQGRVDDASRHHRRHDGRLPGARLLGLVGERDSLRGGRAG